MLPVQYQVIVPTQQAKMFFKDMLKTSLQDGFEDLKTLTGPSF